MFMDHRTLVITELFYVQGAAGLVKHRPAIPVVRY